MNTKKVLKRTLQVPSFTQQPSKPAIPTTCWQPPRSNLAPQVTLTSVFVFSQVLNIPSSRFQIVLNPKFNHKILHFPNFSHTFSFPKAEMLQRLEMKRRWSPIWWRFWRWCCWWNRKWCWFWCWYWEWWSWMVKFSWYTSRRENHF